jgi:hypothetical protein
MREVRRKETMIQMKVTYTLEHGGRFHIIEHVPARVRRETREGDAYGRSRLDSCDSHSVSRRRVD